MKRAGLLLLLAWPARSAELVTPPHPQDPMAVSVHRLANGLSVMLSPNRLEPRLYAAVAVRAGAKDDPADSEGIAHYLEHMLFKGSTRLGTLDYGREREHLDRIAGLYDRLFVETSTAGRAGLFRRIDAESVKAAALAVPNELDRVYSALGAAGVNAWTTEDATVYVTELPSNRAEAWATLEADRFARPVFRLFQTELEAVYEETNASLDDADDRLSEALDRALYRDHPYGRSILGSVEHLKNPSLSKMRAFYERRYVPANMALVLSGDFERDRMLERIERGFSAWPAVQAPAREPRAPRGPRGAERIELVHEAEPKVVVAWPTVGAGHPDEDALDVMDLVMDNAQAGLINLRLQQAQRVKAAGSRPDRRNEAGAWQIWAVPKQGQTLEEAEQLLLETAAALKAGEFTEEDVRSVVTDFEVAEKRRLEVNAERAREMAHAFTTHQGWDERRGRLERLRRIGKADVVRVAARYLGPDRVIAYRRTGKAELARPVKPGFTEFPIDPERRSGFAREVLALPAKPLEPRFLEEGRDYLRREAPWGRLYAATNPVNDLFALTWVFERGMRHDRFLCEALELLELSGGGTLDAEAFRRRLYGLGATMSIACGEQETHVSLTGLEPNLEATLALARGRFEAPNLSTTTLRERIHVRLGGQQDNKKSQQYVFYALSEKAKRGARSAVLRELTPKELSGLELGELQRLARELFGSVRDALYVGRRPAEELERLLAWGRPPYRAAPRYEPLRWERAPKARVLFVEREQLQADVGVFAPDEVYDPAKAVDYLYYNLSLGGAGGVIYQELREARALAYSAEGGYSAGERAGDENILWGAAGTQADKAPQAARLLAGLLKRLPRSKSRFAETKRAIEQDFRAGVVGFRDVPATIHLWERRGIPKDPRPERFRKALAYREADLEAFSRRFWGSTLVFYVLGPPGTIDEKRFADLGAVETLRLEDLFPY